MKARVMHGTAVLAVVLVVALAMRAQIPINQPLMQVDIPFAFAAAGNHMPAGHYRVFHPGDPYVVIIQSDDHRARAAVFVHPSEVATKAGSNKLVFNRYGNQYFLSQVWTETDGEIHNAFKCKAERTLAEALEKPPSTVAVVAKH